MKLQYCTALMTLMILPIAAFTQQDSGNTQGSSQSEPADSNMQKNPPATSSPLGTGIIKVPPATDPAAVTEPPKNIDPAIDDATKNIDKKNYEKSDEKDQATTRGRTRKPPKAAVPDKLN